MRDNAVGDGFSAPSGPGPDAAFNVSRVLITRPESGCANRLLIGLGSDISNTIWCLISDSCPRLHGTVVGDDGHLYDSWSVK